MKGKVERWLEVRDAMDLCEVRDAMDLCEVRDAMDLCARDFSSVASLHAGRPSDPFSVCARLRIWDFIITFK